MMRRIIDADELLNRLNFHADIAKVLFDEKTSMDFYAFSKVADEIDDMDAIDAIPMDWMDAQIRGYASVLKSTELKALVLVKQMWEREQENR